VDGRPYGRTFETDFNRSIRRSRPKNGRLASLVSNPLVTVLSPFLELWTKWVKSSRPQPRDASARYSMSCSSVNLVFEATHEDTVAGQLTHINAAEFPHLRRYAVLLYQRLLHTDISTTVTNCIQPCNQYTTSHTGQLNLLPSVGWKMTTGQSAVMRCGWGVKAGWLIPFVDKHVGGRWNCSPSLKRTILSTLKATSHENALRNFNFFFFKLCKLIFI